jgi:homoserine kinase
LEKIATIRVPASTSNLGPGFDTLGLALKLYLDVDVLAAGPAGGLEVDVEGEGAAGVPRTGENLLHRAYDLAAARGGVDAPAVCFRARSEIPVSRGLGSSAAAVVAGFSAFEAVTGRELSLDRLLELGHEIEGHCDNVAPSILGGLVTTWTPEAGPPGALRREWPAHIRAVVVIPELHLRTAEAREVLPRSVPRGDAIFNLQRVALFHAALAEGRWDLIGEAMRDRLHQPYREPLLPGLREALELEPDGALLGVALSGAGSAVLAFAASEFEAVGARVAACFARHGVGTSTRVLEVDPHGRQTRYGGGRRMGHG